jgi:two-component system cell cycle sensor histidine kinase/response regulator CckA
LTPDTSLVPWAAILDALPASLYVVDRGLHVVAWNSLREHGPLGVPRSEAVGRRLEDVLTPEGFLVALPGIRGVFDTGIGCEEVVDSNRGGRVFHVRRLPISVGDEVTHVLSWFEDVTDRRRAEMALAESERGHRRFVETLTERYFFFRHDRCGHFTYLSPSISRVLGYSAKEYRAHYTEMFTDDPVNAEAIARTERTLGGEVQPPYEIEVRAKDGSVRRLEVTEYPVRAGDGEAGLVEGIARDITEKWQAERALRESEERLRTILDSEPACVKLVAADGTLLAMNRAGLTMIEADDADQVLGKSVYSLLDPSYWAPFQALNRAVFEGQSATAEFEIIGLKGTRRWMESHIGPLRDPRGSVTAQLAVTRDVTERKRAEAVQQATYRIAEAANAAPDLAGLLKALHEIIGELMPAQNFFIALYDATSGLLSFPYWVDERDPPPPPRRLARGLTEQVLRTGLPLHATPEAVAELSRRGEVVEIGAAHVDWIGVPLKAHGKTIGALVIRSYADGVRFHDRKTEILQFVSNQVAMAIERQRAEDRLRESEATYRSLVENAPYGIYRSTPAGRFLAVNSAVVRMLGYSSREEVLRLDLSADVYHDPTERARVLRAVADREDPSVDATWRRKDGRTIAVRMTGHAVRNAEGVVQYYETVVEDVSEREMLEARLRQSQKMEAIGQLAGGVAHDFNNILNVILGYTELLQRQTTFPDPQRDKLEEIRKAGHRAAALTRQLLAFGRKQVLQPKVLDLNAVVEELEKMLRRLIGEHIQLETVFGAERGRITADPGQIEQVIMNLAVNARDAMPQGGRLVIETGSVELDDAYARLQEGARPGPHLLLRVTDTGQGMNAETLSHIFEPFFTTKAPGKGTGLGLATVYGIVKQSGGHIAVQSEPDKGSVFTVYLPRVGGEAEPTRAAEAICARPRVPGSGTVLVLEDDPALCQMIGEVLEDAGYTVLKRQSPEEALEAAVGHPGPIHLVLSDMVMPRMSGAEAVERLTAIRPRIKVLYMSGYTDDAVVRHAGYDLATSFIEKPFTADALLRHVRELLGGQLQ